MTGLKWTKKATRKIAKELNSIGIDVSKNTVGMLLKEMDFSLKVNYKKVTNGGKKLTANEKKIRDEQFLYLGGIRHSFSLEGSPIISVDSKKKELIGNFKNPGRAWSRDGIFVNDHDFPSYAIGKGVPFSIYDVLGNRGTVFLGKSHDTPAFAVDSIEKYWRIEGSNYYPNSGECLILADCGGSNSARSRVWKYNLQTKVCDRYGISITVCHYPPGASKWNPVEHRLHSEITKNWQGDPLDSYEATLKLLRKTKTTTGLTVKAHFVRRHYKLGQKITDRQMKTISLNRHETFPQWNYTINPR